MGKVKGRGNGQGSIYQVPGRRKPWCATISAGWRNGKLVRVARYAASEAEAKRLLRRLRAEHAEPRRWDIPTVADHLEAWLLEVGRRRAPQTTATYRSAAETWIIPALGEVRLDDLTRGQVQALVDDVAAIRRPATAQNVHHTIRAALSSAVRDELVPRNVASLVEGPVSDHAQTAILEGDAARRLVAAIADDWLGPLYVLLLATGLRLGEACALDWRDLDLERGTVAVRQGKTARSVRTVPILAFALPVLRAHRSRAATVDLDSPVFRGARSHDRLTGYVASQHWPRLLRDVGWRPMRAHDLRHAHASLQLAAGTPMRAIADQLGHANPSLTANVYAHLGSGALRDAADRVDDLLKRES
jgi:integrase